jgi:hypothetical protein
VFQIGFTTSAIFPYFPRCVDIFLARKFVFGVI